MMIMPPGDLRDGLVADRADATLFFPEGQELFPASDITQHFNAEAFLEVHFPRRIVWISFALYFDVAANGCIACSDEQVFFSIVLTIEHPLAITLGFEVSVSNPSFSFVGMSATCPAPDCFENSAVNFCECCFADDMAVVIYPSLDSTVEQEYQVSG